MSRRQPQAGPEAGTPAGTQALVDVELTLDPGPRVMFGRGAVQRVGHVALAAAGSRPVLVVTDGTLAGSPVVAAVVDAVAAAGARVEVFAGAVPNPRTETVDRGADRATGLRAGAVLAVGGGSVIDTAKGVALGATNYHRGRRLADPDALMSASLPVVAVPTTAGTAAETTAFGVITDPRRRDRYYLGHPTALPVAVVLDPELSVGLPAAATAATGVDALTHALESLLSVRANPYAAGLALQTVTTVGAFLPRAVADGGDLEARAQLLLAAHTVGYAMATTGLGLVHGLGHALGGRYDVPHGLALAAVLPEVLRLSLPRRVGPLARVALALGAGRTEWQDEANATAAVDAVEELCTGLGLRPDLRELGVEPGDTDDLAATALADPVSANAPVVPEPATVAGLLAGRLDSGSAAVTA